MTGDDPIREFWAWWQTGRDRVLNAIEVERNFSDELIDELSARVDAIGDLDWELGPGKTSKHSLCLSSKGDAEARLVTERWRHLGPPADATWEFFAARQPQPGTLTISDVELDRDELTVSFEVDRQRERLDAAYFHPKFAELAGPLRAEALFLLLDSALGEDDVERWLGAIEAVTEPRADAVPFAEFLAARSELARTATGKAFAALDGTNAAGEPIYATVNIALKRVDHLMYPIHVAIDLALIDRDPDGMPTRADKAALDVIEDELATSLRGLAVWFGRETWPGHRCLHYYTPEDGAAEATIARWAQAHADRRPQVTTARDPKWAFVKSFG